MKYGYEYFSKYYWGVGMYNDTRGYDIQVRLLEWAIPFSFDWRGSVHGWGFEMGFLCMKFLTYNRGPTGFIIRGVK